MHDAHHRKVGDLQRGRAKAMRREPTSAERKLWQILRGRQFANVKFRRQEPIGPYIADFVCFASKLIIEVDGGQHSENARDAVRDAWLAERDLRVVRYSNLDVLTNPDGVAADLARHLSVAL